MKIPDSIGDEKVLKRPLEKNKELVKKAERKISKAVQLLKSGKPTYSDKLRLDEDKDL